MYTFSIYILNFILKIVAVFNPKIKLGVEGRKQTFKILNENIRPNDQTIWFHCASLGEYEQGLPVFEAIKNKYPAYKIVLSFFSPSGYEIRKHSKIADVVVYLPIDTPSNAKRFIDIVHPEFTVFVKYDIWPNYLKALQRKDLRAILISAQFRRQQPYFKWYGNPFRKALKVFEHIFVQTDASKVLLESINITNVSVSGDTRFDRVSRQLSEDNTLDFISEFKGEALCVVIGSSWPEDEQILIPFINANVSQNLKFIIAPHNINDAQIDSITKKLEVPYIRFSEKDREEKANKFVFIVDTIGILSKVYSYADIAYVGGAMGTTGLHNILEPAVFGVPILIGNNHSKFPEASNMISEAGVISVNDYKSLEETLHQLIDSKDYRQELGKSNAFFIKKNKGAVIQIMDSIRI
ncbi:3-deoxy-D-manno-octulosonic acid transferase [Psychroserpens sp. XS_ASV72]|uniref:3-deoxy-D-manno-octulosonic acid transferase n=1 Tax=Psychroserpens sp. XS_ASV72 TaxID=3241293 RepID=UPI0035120CCE